MITVEVLREIGACLGGINAFRQQFPDGANWSTVVNKYNRTSYNDVDCTKDDLAWLARHLPFQDDNDTWEARLELQLNNSYDSVFMMLCPNLNGNDTWEARLALIDNPKYNPEYYDISSRSDYRLILAENCPYDVNPDYASRLSIVHKPTNIDKYTIAVVTGRADLAIKYVKKLGYGHCSRLNCPNCSNELKEFSLSANTNGASSVTLALWCTECGFDINTTADNYNLAKEGVIDMLNSISFGE